MNAMNKIKTHINHFSPREVFSARSFQGLTSPENARQILCRMVKLGEIEPLSRGVFVRKTKATAAEMPSATEMVKFLTALTGEVISIHGAEAARKLGLTTQVPMNQIYYTTGNNRKIKFRNRIVVLKHISPRKLIAHGNIVGEAILALWYLGKEVVNIEMISQLKNQLKSQDFKALQKEIPRMPAWMANIFYLYLKKHTHENIFF